MVSYAYDQAGNRISRRVVPLNSTPDHVKKSEKPTPIEEQLGERKISVYPNPTKGNLGISITGEEIKEKITIDLFNAQGTLLMSKKAESEMTTLQLSRYPTGWYILRVTEGEKIKEFKIIKN